MQTLGREEEGRASLCGAFDVPLERRRSGDDFGAVTWAFDLEWGPSSEDTLSGAGAPASTRGP